jgi:hypothetical protein
MRLTTRLFPIAAGAALVAAVFVSPPTAEAQYGYRSQTGSVRLRIGLFDPDGSSQYWQDKAQDFTGSASDLKDLTFGIDYQWRLQRSSSVLFGFAYFDGSGTNAYRDYVDGNGNDIRHTTTLETWEITVAWITELGQPRAAIKPYLGAGTGLIGWRLREAGDFIDFASAELPIVPAGYQAEGTTYEFFALAGLDFNLGPGWSFFIEGRWRNADDTLGDDFAGFGKLDLSGFEYSGGFAFKF